MDSKEIKDLISSSVTIAIDKAISGTGLEKFEPISISPIVPVNGQILIKVCFKENTKMLVGTGGHRSFNGAKIYVAGTSVNYIALDKEVILNNRTLTNLELIVTCPKNNSSRMHIHNMIKDMKTKDRELYLGRNQYTEIVEYMIVSKHDILAVIQ